MDHVNALKPGARLHVYTIDSILGAGGFGITYKAVEDTTNRIVAIKEYLPLGLAMRDPENSTVRPMGPQVEDDYQWGLEKFRREAQTLVNLNHPNIVATHLYLEANDTAYLVMRYEEGKSLGAILREGEAAGDARLTPDEMGELVDPLLSGLATVHKAGFLHRDIKPDNIYIRADGTPVLLDFGAARHELGEHSASIHALVSAGYSPPEQYHSSGEQGTWTDIYALGATLYRCISGVSPAEAPSRQAAMFVNDRPDPLRPASEIGAGVYDPNLLAAIDAALRVRESERPQTVDAFRAILTGGGDGAAKAPAGLGAKVAAVTAGSADETQVLGSGAARSGAANTGTANTGIPAAGNPAAGDPSTGATGPARQETAPGPTSAPAAPPPPGASGLQSSAPVSPTVSPPLSSKRPGDGEGRRGGGLRMMWIGIAVSAVLIGGGVGAYVATRGPSEAELRAQREKAEAERKARERALREAREKAEREKAAREKAEREAREKAEREKAEREKKEREAAEARRQGTQCSSRKDVKACTFVIDRGGVPNLSLDAAYHWRATAHLDAKRYRSAVRDFTEAIRINPRRHASYNDRGVAYDNLKQYRNALADFSSAIKIKETALYYENRGLIKRRLRQYTASLADLDKSIQLSGRRWQGYFFRGLSYFDLRRYAESARDFTKVIELKPRDADAYFNRGLCYENLNRRNEAIRDYRAALRIDGNYSKAKAGLRRLGQRP
jgi:serine/threonine protein kinase/tetratricopeptide (TPR) repeat protein